MTNQTEERCAKPGCARERLSIFHNPHAHGAICGYGNRCDYHPFVPPSAQEPIGEACGTCADRQRKPNELGGGVAGICPECKSAYAMIPEPITERCQTPKMCAGACDCVAEIIALRAEIDRLHSTPSAAPPVEQVPDEFRRALYELEGEMSCSNEECGCCSVIWPLVKQLLGLLDTQPAAPPVEQGWRHVDEEMPKSGVPVIALITNPLGKTRRIRAAYAATNTLPLDSEAEDDAATYDEATDTYYCSEGWYETNEYEETHWRVEDPVTHWMPLPSPPAPVDQKADNLVADLRALQNGAHFCCNPTALPCAKPHQKAGQSEREKVIAEAHAALDAVLAEADSRLFNERTIGGTPKDQLWLDGPRDFNPNWQAALVTIQPLHDAIAGALTILAAARASGKGE